MNTLKCTRPLVAHLCRKSASLSRGLHCSQFLRGGSKYQNVIIDVSSNKKVAQYRANEITLDDDKETYIGKLQNQIREHIHNGDLKEALDKAIECKKVVKDHFGENHVVYANQHNTMGLILKELHSWEESVDSYTDAVRLYKDLVGFEHASTASAINNLAVAYKAKAMFSSPKEKKDILINAQEMFEQVLDIRKKVLDPAHPDLAVTQQQYGNLLRELGEAEKGEKMIVEAIEILELQYGRNDPRVALAKNDLGYFHKYEGNFSKARELYNEALTVTRKHYSDTHQRVIIIKTNLAELEDKVGNADEAKRIREELLESVSPGFKDKVYDSSQHKNDPVETVHLKKESEIWKEAPR